MIESIHRLLEVRFNSSLARKVLSIYYREGNVYTVPLGAIRGTRLLYSHDLNFHMLLGLWEVRGVRLLKAICGVGEFFGENPIVVDIGANVGYMTLFFSEHVARYGGRVVAFEASPTTFSVLKRNVELNSGDRIDLVQAAVADRDGTLNFYLSHHHHSSSLVEAWAQGERRAVDRLLLNAVSLDSYLEAYRDNRPALIKMDIEGGGIYAIPGMKGVIRRHLPLLFIESHTPEEDAAISSIVREFDYSAFRLEELAWVKEPLQCHPNRNGIWGTMLLCPPLYLERCKRLIADTYGVKPHKN